MRSVLQRVHSATCRVNGAVTGHIETGLLVFLGIAREDTQQDVDWLANKIPNLRLFPDEADKLNRSLLDIRGNCLVISQFTLFGNARKGTRPSFNRAAPPETAIPLYESFLTRLSEITGQPTQAGIFAADMQIQAHNDGPVTLLLDTHLKDL